MRSAVKGAARLRAAPMRLLERLRVSRGVFGGSSAPLEKSSAAGRSGWLAAMLFAGALSLPSAAQAVTERAIHGFGIEPAPIGNLAIDKSGTLFGVMEFGGSKGCGGSGCGAVFQLSRSGGSWKYKQLRGFSEATGKDGISPGGFLVVGPDGAVYGTTAYGGDGEDRSSCQGSLPEYQGCGTVFRLARKGSAWTYSVIYAFQGGADGQTPRARLAVDRSGAVYGTTSEGGKCRRSKDGCGIVFKLTPPGKRQKSWLKSTIHTFDPDRKSPLDGVLLAPDGTLLGSTGAGVVYRLTPKGKSWAYDVVFDFQKARESAPSADLAIDASGNLYGTAKNGSVFRLKAPARPAGSWRHEVLEDFDGGWRSGAFGTPAINDAGAVLAATRENEVFKLLPPEGGKGPWRFSSVADMRYSPMSSLTLGKAGTIFGYAAHGFKTYAVELAP